MPGQTESSIKQLTNRWLQITLLNLVLVALAGALMRYKIAFSLPWVDQKNLLHAHSHFAFTGWITQAIIILMTSCLSRHSGENYFRRYRVVFAANLFTAYSMLISFTLQGYALYSIIFSTLSIFVSWWFAIMYWRDLTKLQVAKLPSQTFKLALFFNVISSAGPFYLAYMMVTKSVTTDRYLASIYYYLHFQYNGWFFFGCLALFFFALSRMKVQPAKQRAAFLLFASACIPAFFLSVLWLKIPTWLYVLVVLATLAQLAGCILLTGITRSAARQFGHEIIKESRVLFILMGVALMIKLVLQTGSTIPSLSHLAFGARPAIIGYLHLVLLGIFTLFLLAFSLFNGWLHYTRFLRTGLIVFVTGIILNELVLMIQGIAAISFRSIPHASIMLLIIALIMLAGTLLLYISQKSKYPRKASKRSNGYQ